MPPLYRHCIYSSASHSKTFYHPFLSSLWSTLSPLHFLLLHVICTSFLLQAPIPFHYVIQLWCSPSFSSSFIIIPRLFPFFSAQRFLFPLLLMLLHTKRLTFWSLFFLPRLFFTVYFQQFLLLSQIFLVYDIFLYCQANTFILIKDPYFFRAFIL